MNLKLRCNEIEPRMARNNLTQFEKHEDRLSTLPINETDR